MRQNSFTCLFTKFDFRFFKFFWLGGEVRPKLYKVSSLKPFTNLPSIQSQIEGTLSIPVTLMGFSRLYDPRMNWMEPSISFKGPECDWVNPKIV